MSEVNRKANDAIRAGFGRPTSKDRERAQRADAPAWGDMKPAERLDRLEDAALDFIEGLNAVREDIENRPVEKDEDDHDRPAGKKAGEFKVNR